ncbi:MAG: hypothetical protein V2A54_13125 [Bacteroidota bacterium]
MITRIKYLIFILLLFPLCMQASTHPKDTLRKFLPGWYYAAQGGINFPSNKTANFHRGDGINSINRFLAYQQNYYIIYQLLGNKTFTYDSTNLPQEMKYSPAMEMGFHFRARGKDHMFFFAELNFYKARTSDFFTLNIDDPTYQFSDDRIVKCGITGVENRNDMNIGFGKIFYKKKLVSPFFSVALNINNTKVTKAEIQVMNSPFSVYNAYYSYNQIEEGGIGLGGMASFGMNAIFNRNFSMELYPQFYWKTINLAEYKRSDFAFSLCLRFLFHNYVNED